MDPVSVKSITERGIVPWLLYKHNSRLHDNMTPRDLLDFRSDLVKLLICPGKHGWTLWSLEAQV